MAAMSGSMAVVALQGCRERICVEYTDRSSAKRAGAFDRGWLPEVIPIDARAIKECHNLDTGETRIHFLLESEARLKEFEATLGRATDDTNLAPDGWQWWPRELEGLLRADQLRAKGYLLFELRDGGSATRRVGAAIKEETREVYMWRTGA